MALVDLRIDELVLRVPGLSRAQADRLGRLIREGLTTKVANGRAPAYTGALTVQLTGLPSIDAPAGAGLEALADRIVNRLAEQLGLEN
ncbi:MAG: hypothetical protein AAF449_10040 [Myxococcota bacterium]